MCGIFAIGLYHRALLLNIYRLNVNEPERPTMRIIGRHSIRDQATESHSVTPGLCDVTSDAADVAGHTASMVCRQFAGVKEAGGIRDEQGSPAEVT